MTQAPGEVVLFVQERDALPCRMQSLAGMIFSCGAFAYLTLFVAVVALAPSIAGLVMALMRNRAARVLSGIGILCAVVAIGISAFGTMRGTQLVDEVVRTADLTSAQRGELRSRGYAEARQCTTLGLGMAGPILGLATLGLMLSLVMKPEQPPGQPPRQAPGQPPGQAQRRNDAGV